MYEFKPYVPPWWEAHRYPIQPGPESEQIVHESYREGVEEIKPLLLQELAQAHAPFTGKATACVLTTLDRSKIAEFGVYGGHALETELENGEKHLVTATDMALNKIPSPNEKIDGIYVMGKDLRKEKHVMPSPTDYDALSERFLEEWGPTIIIVSPDTDEYESVWASKHGPVYGVKHNSDFRVDDIEPQLLHYYISEETGMELDDAQFCVYLQNVGGRNGMEIYLTGSASGRGEISGAVKTGYEDMDFLVVADAEKEEIEAIITELAEHHYGPLTREPKVINDWSSGRQIDAVVLRSAEGKQLQLCIGRTMEEINFRPRNIDRNFYHRIC